MRVIDRRSESDPLCGSIVDSLALYFRVFDSMTQTGNMTSWLHGSNSNYLTKLPFQLTDKIIY